MLKILPVILAFLTVCYFRLAIGDNIKPQMRQEHIMRQERWKRKAQKQFEEERLFSDQRLPSGKGWLFDFLHGKGTVAASEQRLVTVDAAMAMNSEGMYVYLFIGNRVQVLKDGKFLEEQPRPTFGLFDDMRLQAAVMTKENQDKRIYYGDEHGKIVCVIDDIKKKQLSYEPAHAFIRVGGPDAAGRRAGKVYVFKGCQVAVRKTWNDWGKPVNVTTIGLPCDVDAAWNENGNMVILKGDQIWRWNADGTVQGAYKFERFYTLMNGSALKPKREL